jgi:hypothetical protein
VTRFEITFKWPDDSWTWIEVEALDFHEAILEALKQCPPECRVQSLINLTLMRQYRLGR